jgi:hypothetical protein
VRGALVSASRDLSRILLFEQQVVALEMPQPLLPSNRSERRKPGKLKRIPVPPSLTTTVDGPDSEASPVAGSALWSAAHCRMTTAGLGMDQSASRNLAFVSCEGGEDFFLLASRHFDEVQSAASSAATSSNS